MSHFNHLPLYLKLYQLEKYLYTVKGNMSKEYKYSLGENLVSLGWECLDIFLETNILEQSARGERILSLSTTFDKLKLRIRMCQELKLISEGQFAHIQTQYISEIGKMIGGWWKWSNSNQDS